MQDEQDLPADEDYRQTYNFAPSSYGLVYRLDAPDYGTAGSQQRNSSNHNEEHEEHEEQSQDYDDATATATSTAPQSEDNDTKIASDHGSTTTTTTITTTTPKYKLQPMRWGLIPFWTKRTPDYTTTMRTINCRDDSLFTPGGMWNSMKQNKRCIILAQGFYEWLKKPNPGPSSTKDVGGQKIPHFVKRKDGQLMCFAGLFDHVKYEDSAPDAKPLYTYTIITTESNKQLSFLHDRMPVILDNGSDDLFTWLDNVGRPKWSEELAKLLKPYKGELECYPVSKEVGKVGNNSASFIVPLDSVENKQNIMNFFGGAKKAAKTEEVKKEIVKEARDVEEKGLKVKGDIDATSNKNVTVDADVTDENNAPMPVPISTSTGIKREREQDGSGADDDKDNDTHLDKAAKSDAEATPSKQAKTTSNIHKRSRDATSNRTQEKAAAKKTSHNKSAPAAAAGTKKITSFFGK